MIQALNSHDIDKLRELYRPISESEYWVLYDLMEEGSERYYRGAGTRPYRSLSASGMIGQGTPTLLGYAVYAIAAGVPPYPGRLTVSGAVALAFGPDAVQPQARKRVLSTLATQGLWDTATGEATESGREITEQLRRLLAA